jgi:hypothetical protein
MPDQIQRLIPDKKIPIILFILTIIIMLMAGFKPRGYRVFNRVAALADGKGIRLDAPSIIFSNEPWPLGRPQPNDSSFTFSMRLTPLNFCECGITRIISFCDTATREKIIFGQYGRTLIIQDYTSGNKREFDCDSVFRPGKEVSISITSGSRGIQTFVDGKCRKVREDRIFNAGNVIHPAKIVVGNSPDGTSAWEGTIRSMEIFEKELSLEDLAAVDKKPIAFYDFTKKTGFRIANVFGNDKGLYVPRFFTMLKLNILTLPNRSYIWSKDAFKDYIVNFFGFIPFGFLLALLLYLKIFKRITAIALATGIAGFFSLFIELVQVFIPTRDSQLSDLLLNILGALFGALAILLVFRKRQDNS